jgi:hypothetical protein
MPKKGDRSLRTDRDVRPTINTLGRAVHKELLTSTFEIHYSLFKWNIE